MKFTARRQDLSRELSLVQGVVESKATIPILSHMLLKAEKAGLQLLATDLEIGMRTRCAGDVTVPGAATVPARKLFDVVKALDCETVSFESEGNNWLKVEGGSFRGRVVGLPDSDFPVQPEWPKDVPPLRIPLSTFQVVVGRVLHSVTTENTRFSINGALMKVEPDRLTLVATDGHRLSLVERPVDPSGGKDSGGKESAGKAAASVLVPRKALAELARVKTDDENAEIEITSAGNHVFFRTGERVLYSRTLEGNFPSYEKVVPENNPTTARVDSGALAAVIGRVALLTTESSRLVTFSFGRSGLTVSSSNPNIGEASEEMPIELEGTDVKIGLNYDYVMQFLQTVSGRPVEVRLKDGMTQALFQPVDEEGGTYRYVVMPMRLN